MSVCGKRFSLEVPNDTTAIPLISDFVFNMARLTGFEEDDAADIRVAVVEAADNVIHHAFAPEEEASFDVICEPTQLGLGIIISEMGMPFDPSRASECSVDTRGRVTPEGEERGICLMKRTMDEVSFHNLGKRGKETRLFKYIETGANSRCVTKAERKAADEAKTEYARQKGSASYLVRRLDPVEAVEVSKCAYGAYHYSYFYEYMYYPERVKRLNETDQLISYVAVTPEREIMGHAALRSEKERGVAELMAAFVRPEYRGRGCLNALTEALIGEGRARGLSGLYVRAVTSHPYSQKTALKYGFSGSCLYLAQYDPLEFIELAAGKMQRESMLHAFVYLHRPAPFRIYPPLHHKEMVIRIYEGLGIHPEVAYQQIEQLQADSSVRVIVEPYHTAKIEVLEYGEDLAPKVKRTLRALCLDRIEAVYLFLELCNPLTALIAAEFENMGFFFAGISPGAAGTDLLVLQFLNNLEVDYDRLQFASEMGRQIAEYIRLHDSNKENVPL